MNTKEITLPEYWDAESAITHTTDSGNVYRLQPEGYSYLMPVAQWEGTE